MRLDQVGSMRHVPVHNQGNLGTCYAHAISQATDAYIHTFTKGNEGWQTSTTMLGTEYRDNFFTHILGKNTDIEGGYVCSSFRRGIKKHGACSANAIEGLLDKMYAGTFAAYRVSRLFNDLTFIFEETHKSSKKSGKLTYVDGAKQLLGTLQRAGALAADLPSISEIDLALHSRTNLQFALKFFSYLCKSTPRIQLNNTKCRTHHLWLRGKRGLKKLIQDIRAKLKKDHAQPIMISYCADVLEKGRDFRGLGNTILDPIKTARCGYHASAIIGFREKNKRPELLVRNSWGESCFSYSSDWECDRGNLWIDAETLAKNMTDYHILQQKR